MYVNELYVSTIKMCVNELYVLKVRTYVNELNLLTVVLKHISTYSVFRPKTCCSCSPNFGRTSQKAGEYDARSDVSHHQQLVSPSAHAQQATNANRLNWRDTVQSHPIRIGTQILCIATICVIAQIMRAGSLNGHVGLATRFKKALKRENP